MSRFSHETTLILARLSTLLSRNKQVKPSVIKTLQQEIRRGNAPAGAYELLANLSGGYQDKLDTQLVVDAYSAQKEALTNGTNDGANTFVNVLKLLAVGNPPKDASKVMVSEILQSLTEVHAYHTLMPSMLRAIVALGPNKKWVKEQLQELLANSQRRLQEFCKARTISGVEPNKVAIIVTKHILLIGELAMLHDGTGDNRKPTLKVPQEVETYLQAIIQTPIMEEAIMPTSPLAPLTPSSHTMRHFNPLTPGLHQVDPDMSQFSAISLSQLSQTSQFTNMTARHFGENGAIPATLLSAALLTFGKLCLLNESLAKKYIPVFVNQLRKSSDEVIKCNILTILSDLCVE